MEHSIDSIEMGEKMAYSIVQNIYDAGVDHKLEMSLESDFCTFSFYETITVTEGQLCCNIEGVQPVVLHVGDAIFFPPNVKYSLEAPPDIKRLKSIAIKFSPLFLYPMELTRSDVDSLLFSPNYTFPYYLFRNGTLPAEELVQLLKHIENEHHKKTFGYELALRGSLTSLYIWLVRNCSINETEHFLDEDSTYKLYRILQYLEQNYPYNISIQDVADACEIPCYRFSRFFKKITDKNFKEYLLEMRLNYAQKELLQIGKSVSDVAMDCGFEYVSYFIQTFKKKNGMTPKEYQKKYRDSELNDFEEKRKNEHRSQLSKEQLRP